MSQKSQPDGCQYRGRVDKAVREVEAQKGKASYARISQLTIDSAAMLPRLPKPRFVLLSTGPGGPIEMLQSSSSCKHISPQASCCGRTSSMVGAGTSGGNSTSTGAVVVNVPQAENAPLYIAAQHYTKKLLHLTSNNLVAIV